MLPPASRGNVLWRQDRTKVLAVVIAKGLRGCSLQGRERDAAWPNSSACGFKRSSVELYCVHVQH